MDSEKKYYWLKLKRDFFKRHDIRIVEEMPNGKDYILFYLKMLVESVDHEGGLRFNDTIPYNDEMLATITNTNIDIVRAAMALFTELGMIEILDNGTIYMSEVLKMIGSAASSDNAIRQQRFRDKKRQEVAELAESVTGSVTKSNASVTQAVTNSNESKSKSKSKSKEIELEYKENIQKKNRFVAPSVDEVQAYCNERNNQVDAQKFVDYYTANGWKVGKNAMKDWKACVRTWERNNYDRPLNSVPSRSGGNEFTALLEQMEAEDE